MTHLNSNPSSLPKRILSQFATYRITLSRVIVVTTFVVISLLAMLPEVSRAQCPPANVPDPSITVPWDGPNHQYETLSSGCLVLVTYCIRYVGGVEQVIFTGVFPWNDPSPSNPCNGMAPGDIIRQGIQEVMTDANIGLMNQLNPCDGTTYTIISDITATCWGIQHSINPATGYLQDYYGPCFNGTSWCQTTCGYCMSIGSIYPGGPSDQQIAEPFNCTYQYFYSGDCQAELTESPWLPEQCYDINPCGSH